MNYDEKQLPLLVEAWTRSHYQMKHVIKMLLGSAKQKHKHLKNVAPYMTLDALCLAKTLLLAELYKLI